MSKNVRRRGFTLPEVLVTITIVAVLAAVVVPAVLNQVSKGDTAGLAGDVDALRSAISNFTTDTRKYPNDINNLIGKPLSTDDDLFSSDYGPAAINAWKGPYFPTPQDTATIRSTGYSTSAFNLIIDTDFEVPSSANGFFITLDFTPTVGLTATTLATLDRLFDGGDGTLPAGTGTGGCANKATDGSQTGNIRWTENANCDTFTALKWRLVSAAQ